MFLVAIFHPLSSEARSTGIASLRERKDLAGQDLLLDPLKIQFISTNPARDCMKLLLSENYQRLTILVLFTISNLIFEFDNSSTFFRLEGENHSERFLMKRFFECLQMLPCEGAISDGLLQEFFQHSQQVHGRQDENRFPLDETRRRKTTPDSPINSKSDFPDCLSPCALISLDHSLVRPYQMHQKQYPDVLFRVLLVVVRNHSQYSLAIIRVSAFSFLQFFIRYSFLDLSADSLDSF
jgi:hypothetical protein